MSMSRSSAAPVVAVVAALALAGCGGSKAATPATGGSSSPSSSTTSSSSATSSPAKLDPATFAQQVSSAMVAKKTGHMTMTAAGAQTGSGDFDLASGNTRVQVNAKGLTIEAVLVAKILYIKGIPGSPRPWVKIDPNATDKLSKAFSSVFDLSKSNDPRTTVALLKDSTGTDVGAATVLGQQTEHYHFSIPVSAYSAILKPAAAKQFASVVKKPVSLDLWVRPDHLPVRGTTVVDISGKTTTSEVTYSDWGKPVNVSAPPASQVISPPKS